MESIKTKSLPIVLTIGGSDSSGGAGIQADLKTFHHWCVFGTTAVTLVTAQNTGGIWNSELLSEEMVRRQIEVVVDDFAVSAVKTGALGSKTTVQVVADTIQKHSLKNIVVDPVMLSKGGDLLIDTNAVELLKEVLVPCARIITPNIREAEILTGKQIKGAGGMPDLARELLELGSAAVVLKGANLEGEEAVDIFYDGIDCIRLGTPKVETRNTHGTGCTLSAAITARLAHGDDLIDAVHKAKHYVYESLNTGFNLGSGQGPINHWGLQCLDAPNDDAA